MRQRTTWETVVQEDMRRLSSVVVVPNRGPRQEDIDAYLDEFDKMKRGIGLAPFTKTKWINTMCKKKHIKPRRILMDVCPQLERRFGALNKLQHRFRHQQEAEMGPGTKCQTRIECAEDTIVIQYRFDEKETWRNLDAEKHYKKEQIPGVPGTSAESS